SAGSGEMLHRHRGYPTDGGTSDGFPGVGLRVVRQYLLARGTDIHLPTPRRRLDPERWRIQAALTERANEGRGGAGVPRGPLGHAPTEGRGQRLLEGGHHRAWTPSAVTSSGNDCATSRRDLTIIAPVSACHHVSYVAIYRRSSSRETL